MGITQLWHGFFVEHKSMFAKYIYIYIHDIENISIYQYVILFATDGFATFLHSIRFVEDHQISRLCRPGRGLVTQRCEIVWAISE